MAGIDLHAHSTASDGTESPGDVVRAAAVAGLEVVALTDHDTTHGWADAVEAAAESGVALLRGIEISTQRYGVSVHLLGYLIDPAHPGLSLELGRAREARERRLELMVESMAADGLPVTYAQVLAAVPPGATPGRPHIADALVASGVVSHRDEAFARWLGNESPYYLGHYAPDPVRAVELVVEAGGVAVYAHPFTMTRGRVDQDFVVELVEEMTDAGLSGLEVDHRDHDEQARARGRLLAARLELLTTGSSDYHGTGKRNRLGENTTDPQVLAEIERRATSATKVLR